MDKPHHTADHRQTLQAKAVIFMGDKSPKAKDKSKKQDTAGKNQKKAAAVAKATPAPGGGKKSSK